MPALTDTRLSYLRYTTRQYIESDPTPVTLIRKVKVAKPGGGHDFTKVPISEQIFRFINQDITVGMAYSVSDDISRRFSYVMLGEHDADIEINDSWVEGDRQYKIEGIIPNNGWENRCYVTCFAKEPDKG